MQLCNTQTFVLDDSSPDDGGVLDRIPHAHLLPEHIVRHHTSLEQQQRGQNEALEQTAKAARNDTRRHRAQHLLAGRVPGRRRVAAHLRPRVRLQHVPAKTMGEAEDGALEERLDESPGQVAVQQARQTFLCR